MIQSLVADDSCTLDKSLLRPLDYPGLTRLGTASDGGYVIPADQIAGCQYLVSLGLGKNWQFDVEFASRNPLAKIVSVDHTVGPRRFLTEMLQSSFKAPAYALAGRMEKSRKHAARLRNSLNYFTFFHGPHRHLKKRVAHADSALDISLDRIFASLPTSGAIHDCLLKMDIEGSEYEVIDDIVRHQRRIRCLAAEFHELDTRTADFNAAVSSLREHFALVHIHGNNYGAYDDHIDFPVSAELTFVNKSLIKRPLALATCSYPRPGLDVPNNPAIADYALSLS
jgi:hypothetical protein